MLLISEKRVDSEASAKYGGLRFETVPAVAKPPGYSLRMLSFGFKLWQSVRQSRRLIQSFQADAVLGMGGFTSLPPVFAGYRRGLKTFIHDSNSRPGKANLLTARFCDRIFLGLAAAKPFFPGQNTLTTGTPVRPEVLALPAREEAAERLGLDPRRPVLLVTGGSQGAQRLNELCVQAGRCLAAGTQVVHLAGTLDFARIAALAGQIPDYHVHGFCDRMADVYAVADLVVARAGASSLTEIAAAGLPSVLVPYPYAADDHQTRNAEVFANAGAAVLAPEHDLSCDRLATMINGILGDAAARERMAAAAHGLALPDAAERVSIAIEATLSTNQ